MEVGDAQPPPPRASPAPATHQLPPMHYSFAFCASRCHCAMPGRGGALYRALEGMSSLSALLLSACSHAGVLMPLMLMPRGVRSSSRCWHFASRAWQPRCRCWHALHFSLRSPGGKGR